MGTSSFRCWMPPTTMSSMPNISCIWMVRLLLMLLFITQGAWGWSSVALDLLFGSLRVLCSSCPTVDYAFPTSVHITKTRDIWPTLHPLVGIGCSYAFLSDEAIVGREGDGQNKEGEGWWHPISDVKIPPGDWIYWKGGFELWLVDEGGWYLLRMIAWHVDVVELPLTPEDDLRSTSAVLGRRTS